MLHPSPPRNKCLSWLGKGENQERFENVCRFSCAVWVTYQMQEETITTPN